jgi:hypothetical protein
VILVFSRAWWSLGLVPVFALLLWGSLNVSGFCFPKQRYLSHNEFFAEFLTEETFLSPTVTQLGNWTNDAVATVKTYPDSQIYLRKNPDCCFFGGQKGVLPDGQNGEPGIFSKFFGQAWGVVAVRSRHEYTTPSGQTKTYEAFLNYWADSCGNRVPFIRN